ncbi:MAG: hypothetical protein BYD32DRAFT_434177 [Podila humilis]|nr:MAG: hypothetical protein BYD32DRAFT_434177 [Podila humilis]
MLSIIDQQNLRIALSDSYRLVPWDTSSLVLTSGKLVSVAQIVKVLSARPTFGAGSTANHSSSISSTSAGCCICNLGEPMGRSGGWSTIACSLHWAAMKEAVARMYEKVAPPDTVCKRPQDPLGQHLTPEATRPNRPRRVAGALQIRSTAV